MTKSSSHEQTMRLDYVPKIWVDTNCLIRFNSEHNWKPKLVFFHLNRRRIFTLTSCNGFLHLNFDFLELEITNLRDL